MTLLQRLMSAEEFWALAADSNYRSLVRGEVIETMPPGGLHGIIAAPIVNLLTQWAKLGQYGIVGVESGFILLRNPDTVRSPDVYFVQAERLPSAGIPSGFWEMWPDLAVEIISPTETANEVRAKVRDYLDAHTSMVWEVYPNTHEVIVHTGDGLARAYRGDEELSFPDILPGFICKAAVIFE